MRKYTLLISVLLFATLLKLFRLESLPPLLNTSQISLRYISVFFSIVNIILVYYAAGRLFNKEKIGLLSAFIMGVLPLTLEQSRIVSSLNTVLFFMLLIFLMMEKTNKKPVRYVLLLLIPFFIYFLYPQFWLVKHLQIIPLTKVVTNFFTLFSPEMWFFKNITFYHGGLREWGFLFLSLLPFFLIGLYKAIVTGKGGLIVYILVIAAITSFNPSFPEAGEFYLVAPVIAVLSSFGIYQFTLVKQLLLKFFFGFLIAALIYEISQLTHFYFVHYPLQVNGSITNITEPF